MLTPFCIDENGVILCLLGTGTKESVDGVECQTKVERNSPLGTHFQNTASPKNTNNQSSSLMGSAILKTALTNFTAGNGNSTGKVFLLSDVLLTLRTDVTLHVEKNTRDEIRCFEL